MCDSVHAATLRHAFGAVATWAVVVAVAERSAAVAQEHPTNVPGSPAAAVSGGEASERASGEPYRLRGHRIVFTNWFYVRPGGHAWVNEKGEGVSARRDVDAGDWGARFVTYDMPRGVRLRARPAERREGVIQPEEPWEGRFAVTTLIQHDGKLRFWGSTGGKPCYLESEDGVVWTRPTLGLVDFEGSQENNLYPGLIGETVFIDPSSSPEQRYKAVGTQPISVEAFEKWKTEHPDRWEPRAWRRDCGHVYALHGAVSPDGFNWRLIDEPLSVEHADTQNTGEYDPVLRQYVMYTRTWWVGEQARPAGVELSPDMRWIAPGRRSIGRSASPTFSDFPVSQPVLVPSPSMKPSDVLYTNCKTSIPGQPDNHLMFPAVWDVDSDSTRLVLASSTDGRLWDWVPEGTVLRTAEFGRFDGGSIFASPHLVELANGDFALPYNGYRFPHKYPRGGEGFLPNLGFAVWPKGRIVALETEGVGEFATVGFIPPVYRLSLNAVTARSGHIRVAVCRLKPSCFDLQPIEGFGFDECRAIIGDQPGVRVEWAGGDGLGVAPGEPVALAFRLKQAKLFALEFR